MSRNTPHTSHSQSVLRLRAVPFCGSLMSATELQPALKANAILFGVGESRVSGTCAHGHVAAFPDQV